MNNRKIWLGGKILPLEEAKINVLTPTSQFGANVFEGIRCYWSEIDEQLYAFRLYDHYKRLKNSMKMFIMDDKYTMEELKQALVDVVIENDYKEDIAVRQTIFLDGFGSWASSNPINMFVAPIPKGRILNGIKKGFKCCISSWTRISDRNISPRVKVGANYINSRMAQLEALRNGCDSTIFMNDIGKISEGPGSCLFIIRDGKLITPPSSASVLESITKDTIIKIAKDEFNIETLERNIDRTELYICDEAFLCGSAMEIVPILEIDGYEIKDSNISNKIQNMYLNIVRGKLKKYENWLTPIYK